MRFQHVLSGPMTPLFGSAEKPKDIFVVGRHLYVVCNESNMVKVLALEDLSLVTEIPVGKKLDFAVLVERCLLVASSRENTLTRIDPKSMKATGTLSIGGGIARMAATGGYVIVPRFDRNDYVIVDADKMALVGNPVPTQSDPRAASIMIEKGKQIVYVACAGGRTIMSFEFLTGTVISAKVGVKGSPRAAFHGLVSNPLTEKLYAPYASDDGEKPNQIAVFDAGSFVDRFELPDEYTHGQMIWLDGFTLAVACQTSVVVVDVFDGAVLDQLTFDGAEPFGLAAVLNENSLAAELFVGVKEPNNAVFKLTAETEPEKIAA